MHAHILPVASFYGLRECFDRSISIKPTKRDSLSTSGRCPLCKTAVNKRSAAPAEAIRALVAAYEAMLRGYEADTGKQWGFVEEELARKQTVKPVENLSETHPYPEKPAADSTNKAGDALSTELEQSTTDEDSPRQSIPRTYKPVVEIRKTVRPSNDTALLRGVNFTVSTSLVSREMHTSVLEWSETFGCHFVPVVDTDTSHLLVQPEKRLVARRTFKYCRAVLLGLWVLSVNCTAVWWSVTPLQFLTDVGIEECLKRGELLPMEPYEILGDDSFPDSGGPRRSRLSRRNMVSQCYATGWCRNPGCSLESRFTCTAASSTSHRLLNYRSCSLMAMQISFPIQLPSPPLRLHAGPRMAATVVVVVAALAEKPQ